MKKFKDWLIKIEENYKNNYVKEAILGLVKASNLSQKDQDDILRSNVGQLDKDTLRELQNLGIIRSMADSNPNKYVDIINSITKGSITFFELIEKIQGQSLAPKATIK